MSDHFDLDRFVKAQDLVMAAVRAELAVGQKRSHWMWFVFPQLAGLGRSPTARLYGLSGWAEAAAYADHPVLGPRLVESCGLVLGVTRRSAHQIFGSPDDIKLRSSLTLFATVWPGQAVFRQALDRYFAGEPDPGTLALLP